MYIQVQLLFHVSDESNSSGQINPIREILMEREQARVSRVIMIRPSGATTRRALIRTARWLSGQARPLPQV